MKESFVAKKYAIIAHKIFLFCFTYQTHQIQCYMQIQIYNFYKFDDV